MDSVKLLEEMVSVHSPSGKEGKLAELLAGRAREMKFEAEIDSAGNFMARTWGKGKKILLVSHLDTVEGKIPVRIENGKLFGRGSIDAKGSLAAMICAASKFIGKANIAVAGVVEEESASSRGARHLLETFEEPDCTIVGEPSSWEGITIGYKGKIIVGYSVERENFHGAANEKNATEEAIEFCNEAGEYCKKFQEKGVFDSPQCRVNFLNSEKNEFSGKAEAQIEFRTPENFDFEALTGFLKGKAGSALIEFFGREEAVVSGKNNFLVKALLSAIREEKGKPVFKKKTGTSDMNVLAKKWKCPMVAYGPGDSNLDHTKGEHVELEEFQKAIGVLEGTIARLVSGQN